MNEVEFRKIPERHWGYGHVRPRTEKKVKEKLDSFGIVSYLPLRPKARMHHSSKVISYLPMLPGYIFVCLSDAERHDLKIGEKNFVRIELIREEMKEALFLEELKVLRCCEELAKSEPVLINPDIVAGDEVEVHSGPLAGLKTYVIRRADETDSIIINLTLLNIHAEFPVSAETLKKITE